MQAVAINAGALLLTAGKAATLATAPRSRSTRSPRARPTGGSRPWSRSAMADVLGEIVARKRTDVAERLAGIGLAELRAKAAPTARSLRAALARPGARFIMEVKKASPSPAGSPPPMPARQARAYAGAADAVSVLTDAPYFGGSLDDLRAVRAAFDGPVLAKDFVDRPAPGRRGAASPAPMRCWSCSRCSTTRRRAG
jgi:hypothetical protein